MAIYVDNVKIAWRGYLWCHLVADSESELHAFAEQLGLQRCWYQIDASYPHYDVTVEQRDLALTLGAIEGSRRQIISCAKKLQRQLHDNQPLPKHEIMHLLSDHDQAHDLNSYT